MKLKPPAKERVPKRSPSWWRCRCRDTANTSILIAEVPELPGCAADGPSYHEAIEAVEDVIDGWIETATEMGRTIPEPKGRRLMLA